MVDRRPAWFLHEEEWRGAHGSGLHDKTCHFCRQCNGDWSGQAALSGERAPTAGALRHIFADGETNNKDSDNVHNFVTFLGGWLPFVTNIIIPILIHVVNVLHLTSPAGCPFVTPWHSITRELSLCGNLSRAQRRVSVTAQLAPRAGRPQVATAGTVSFHSDLPPLVSAQPPWGAPRWEGQWCHHWATVTGGRSERHRNGTKHFCRGQPIFKGHYCDAPSLRQN